MKLNKFDLIANIASIVILLAATIFVPVNWGNLPEQIPSHYNFKGEPNAYGGKGTLIFMMIVNWLVLLTMIIIGNFPQLWNTGVERTPANEVVINRIVRDMLSVMEISMAMLFGYLLIVPAVGANMGIWFMPLFLTLTFGNLIVMTVRLIRNR